MGRLPYPKFQSELDSPKHETLNVFKILSYSPSTVNHWINIGHAHFKSLSLTKRDRELAIFLSTAKFKSTYEWTHHLAGASRVGITKSQLVELEAAGSNTQYFGGRHFRTEAGFSERDVLLLSLVEAIIEHPHVSDALWAKAKHVFSEREIVELISIQVFLPFWIRCLRGV